MLQDKTIPAARKSGGWAETLRTVIYAVLIALGIRTFAFEPFSIPSGSMIPTLLIGDYLFVSKFSYGYSYRTIAFGLPLFEGRILGADPQRGDVAVFKLPRDPSVDYIKRVIGLPGDRIQVKGGILYINDQAVERRQIEAYVGTCSGQSQVTFTQYIETLPNGVEHRVIERSDSAGGDNTSPYVVPAGQYFMMGDNRDCSLDSRVEPDQGGVGYVPVENFVGRAEFLWFSLENASFLEVWKWPFAMRLSRMFTSVS
jgi:signal peptidase I